MMKQAILINATFQIGHHGCTLVDRQLDQLATESRLNFKAKLPLNADWTALAPAQFDLVLVNGEGGLHHDSKAAKLIAQVPQWARARNKPVHLINSVYEANSAEIAAGVAQYDSIFVRDELSRQALAFEGIPSSVVADLALTWEPPASRGSGREIVVTDSTLHDTNQALHGLSRSLNARFLPLMARPPRPSEPYCDRLRWRRYASKRLLANLAPPGLWRDRWRGLIPEFDDFARYLTSHAGLIVAGRFHAVCLALNLEIPLLAVRSNTWKIEALLKEVELEHRIIADLESLKAQLSGGSASALFSYSIAELERIRAFRAQTRGRAHRMFESLTRAAPTRARME